MGLQLAKLDARTRMLMVEELERDVASGSLYLSSRLTDQGRLEWPFILRAAMENGDDSSLAGHLRAPGRLNATETRRRPKGGVTIADVPVTAPENLAEGEFNRYYARGLCLRAIADGIPEVEVCRAKEVRQPRPESTAMIGTRLDAAALLEDLRTHQGVEPALGLPPGPNSGLSVQLA